MVVIDAGLPLTEQIVISEADKDLNQGNHLAVAHRDGADPGGVAATGVDGLGEPRSGGPDPGISGGTRRLLRR